jgi:hypothetical protein
MEAFCSCVIRSGPNRQEHELAFDMAKILTLAAQCPDDAMVLIWLCFIMISSAALYQVSQHASQVRLIF